MATELETPLNEQQIMMLRLFRRPLPDADFQKMRRLAVQLLGGQLDDLIGNWEKENDITEDYYKELSKGHFRSKRK
jgi:hypothetical protein